MDTANICQMWKALFEVSIAFGLNFGLIRLLSALIDTVNHIHALYNFSKRGKSHAVKVRVGTVVDELNRGKKNMVRSCTSSRAH